MRYMSGVVFEGIAQCRFERVSRMIEHCRAARAVRNLSGDIRSPCCSATRQARWRMSNHIRRVLVECARCLPNQGLPLPRPQGEEELQAGRLRHRPQAGPRDPCGPEEPGACTDPGTDYRDIMGRRNAPCRVRRMKDCGIEQPAAGQAATQPA